MEIPSSIPIEVQAALDLVALLAGCQSGRISGWVIGDPTLVDAVEHYAPVDADGPRLIAAGADPRELAEAVRVGHPNAVITLVEGRLAAPLRPLRAGPLRLAADLQLVQWQRLGYRRVTSRGVQGLAALVWAALDRLMTSRGRPDLADRCRIAMLRTLAAGGLSSGLGTVAVREYRRLA